MIKRFVFYFLVLALVSWFDSAHHDTVYADGLHQVGAGTANSIWSQACEMLPYCGEGAHGLEIITNIVSGFILWTIGPAAILLILYASIRLITSTGNDETIRKVWKEMIFYAILGLILAVLADTIINWIYNVITRIVSM